MAERITIAELNIDDSELLRATKEIRAEINRLRQSQKELDDSTEEGSVQFEKNAATISQLNTAYRQNQRAIQQRLRVVQNATVREEMLEQVLGQEVTTITEAREQTRILTQLRNETNATTEEGAALIAQLNEQLDRNTAFVNENADGYLRLKLNIGNYAEGVREALNEINPLNDGLLGFIQRSQQAGGVGALLTQSLTAVRTAMLGLTQSALAFLATPIGVVVLAIAAAFALVQNALNRSEEATGKLRVAFGAISGIINRVLAVLEPLGTLLIDGIVAGFELAAEAVNFYLDTVSGVLDFLGFETAAESVQGFTDALNEAAAAGMRLAQAESELRANQRRSQLIQLEYQRTAEKLRQTRDNDVLSIRERIAANDRLGEVLQEQLREELRIANLALEVANLRLEAEGRTEANLDAQAEALTQIADIQERITGQESEQLTNRNALLKEAAEKARTRAEALVAELELAAQTFTEENRLAAETAEQKLAIDEQLADRELLILQTRLENRLITEQQFNLEQLKIANRLTEQREAIREQELERQADFERRRDELQNNINLLREEDEQLREELRLQQEFEKQVLELERLQLNEEQKTELLAQLEEQRGLMLQAIRDRFDEESLDALRKTLEAENNARRTAGQASVEVQRQIAGALAGLLGDSLAARLAGITIDAALQIAQIQTTTAASQATNLAQATAAAPPPLNIPFISAAITQNAGLQANAGVQTGRILTAAAVQGLTSSLNAIKFRKGGFVEINGPSHEGGGVPIYAGNQYVGEAEGHEGIGILNKAAFSDFMAYNNSFNAGNSTGQKFQGGGIITQAINPAQSTDDMVQGVAEAIREMQVFVSVEDINTGQQNFAQVTDEANLS